MADGQTVTLLEADPELLRQLPENEREMATRVRLPLLELPRGQFAIHELLSTHGAFAALVLEGMLLQRIRLGDRQGMRLIGPGDLLSRGVRAPSLLELEVDVHATTLTRIALLGLEFLRVASRWPAMVVRLHEHSDEQAQRLLTQLMICQLPRVEDRLLAIMWMLAELWGRVTGSGTVLPVRLTHDALGGLVGARRPTVTLALQELSARGALVSQHRGWLLLERPPPVLFVATAEAAVDPWPIAPPSTQWAIEDPVSAPGEQSAAAARDELRATLAELQAEHALAARRLQQRLALMAEEREHYSIVRQQAIDTRERIIRDRQSRQPAPSS